MGDQDESWERDKKRHLALSAAAADRYDEIYEQANFATGNYMRYEIETVQKAISLAPRKTTAVDLGCGTGRASVVLAKHFDHVYAYDFSAEMIEVATRRKLGNNFGNILFEQRDVEKGSLPLPSDSVALVNTGFGMGSFVKDLPALFREIRRVLVSRGIAVFSFYNTEALSSRLTLQWPPALAAQIVPGTDQLRVNFENQDYQIAAKAYANKDVRYLLERNFLVHSITTFPILSALFPQTLFADEKARELCRSVDYALAGNPDLSAGPYIVAVCSKKGPPGKEHRLLGYERVLEVLRVSEVKAFIQEHRPVRSMAEVKEVLQDLEIPEAAMVKSILVAVPLRKEFIQKEEAVRHPWDVDLYLVGIPANRMLQVGKLANVLGLKRKAIRFADQVEVEQRTGFAIGSIPPFGLPKDVSVILDERLLNNRSVWCGTGRLSESLQIDIDDLRKISMATVADVSAPLVDSDGSGADEL